MRGKGKEEAEEGEGRGTERRKHPAGGRVWRSERRGKVEKNVKRMLMS